MASILRNVFLRAGPNLNIVGSTNGYSSNRDLYIMTLSAKKKATKSAGLLSIHNNNTKKVPLKCAQ